MGGVLQTKKKYGGMLAPKGGGKRKFEAKGLETVRRDQCGLTRKVLRRSLEIYLSGGCKKELRAYLERVWRKVLVGRVPVQDFIITGRVRSSYREGGETCAAHLVKRLSETDPGLSLTSKQVRDRECESRAKQRAENSRGGHEERSDEALKILRDVERQRHEQLLLAGCCRC